ncbi:hypothetical protein PR202_gb24912 [Eleusine coracana subsp. coracana]|uniref:DUF1618 domain-containing protein n=1 Tax=Eleusine coracana subsp. coracana TaxID=191504 RepID=A0AAV5FP77_ELECO|nr:hypothetical protein PR202_gb24912 [Eleusine coracana subsp. coracana]
MATMDQHTRHHHALDDHPTRWAMPMLDTRGCVADVRNASTAYGRTSTGVAIQKLGVPQMFLLVENTSTVNFAIYLASKVIMMGEEDIMGFVDLMVGILVCDVLSCTHLYHIPFPKPLKVKQQPDLDPVIYRDIVVVQDIIKVVDCSRCSAFGRWKASIWSRKATCREETWRMDHVNPWNKNAWVLAVDMGQKKLQDVGVFRAERSSGTTLSYMPSDDAIDLEKGCRSDCRGFWLSV